jgi:hypothetical protein
MLPQLTTHHSKLKTVFLFFLLASLSSAQTTINMARQFYGLGDLRCAAYSPDGKYIATCGTAGAFLWEIETGEVVRMFSGHWYVVSSVAFSPDGTKVLYERVGRPCPHEAIDHWSQNLGAFRKYGKWRVCNMFAEFKCGSPVLAWCRIAILHVWR